MKLLRFKKHKYIIFLIVIALFLLVFIRGSKSPELKAMEKSASVLRLTTGRQVARRQEDHGTTLGKPTYPQVVIEYKPFDGYELEDVHDEIITIMKINNWTNIRVGTVTGSSMASLWKDDFTIEAVVSIRQERDTVAVQFATIPHK